jgi:nicotinamide mononucleotide transporter
MLIVASAVWKSPWYGFVASITGMICVVLVAKGRISNYWFGIVNCIFYAYTAYTWLLYGEVMLNMLYFLPMQFVGLMIWRRNATKENKDKVKIKFLSNYDRFLWLCITAFGVFGYKIILTALGGNLPLIDSMSTVVSVIAMILMAKLYMEQWILWIVVDIVSVIMWFVIVFKQGSNDIGILIMWSAYLVNAVYGLVNWIKMYNDESDKKLMEAFG